MRIVDEKLLEAFRYKGRCEVCHRLNHSALEPHHIFAKGMGSGGRLDIRLNLISLCRFCHQSVHDGNMKKAVLLEIVSKREKVTVDFIESEIYRLRRLPKEATP